MIKTKVLLHQHLLFVCQMETTVKQTWLLMLKTNFSLILLKVARYSFSGSIPPKFERKLRRHKQRFGKINITVVLDKDENLL